MTTTDLQTALIRQASADAQRSGRALALTTIRQEQRAALERAADLFLAGLWHNSRFVAEQARGHYELG